VSDTWITVDRQGLRQIVAGRRLSFALFELLSNAFDEATTRVSLTLAPIEGARGRCSLVCEDDNPTGFANLAHAYTMFAASGKKGDAQKRGRFNVGEKLVLALCDRAEIVTTTGHVRFNEDGTRSSGRDRTTAGSRFAATIRMTRAELADALVDVRRLIPPPDVETLVNGERLLPRVPLATFTTSLQTIVSDDEGVLRPRVRQTEVSVYEPLADEPAAIYELGIPVVELDGDRFSVNVHQKVPLTQDRDNVPPAYLRTLRAQVLNHTVALLTEADAKGVWIDHALAAPEITSDVVREVIEQRYGDKVASFSPSDLEANKKAADNGYAIVHGGSFSAEAWGSIREAGAIKPAGRLFPTGRGIGAGVPWGTAPPAVVTRVPESDYTAAMRAVAQMVRDVGDEVIGKPVNVRFVTCEPNDGTRAMYESARTIMTFNLSSLGEAWFRASNLLSILDLVIHELAHEYVSDHFSESYYRETTRIGACLAMVALERPELFVGHDARSREATSAS